MKAGYLVMESKHPQRERARATGSLRRGVLAFCTVAVVTAAAVAVWTPTAVASPEDVARHVDHQLRAGAVSLPLDAELEYAYALASISKGDLEGARKHLQSSIALAPHFTDSYFTLARIEARRLSPDAIFWFVQGVVISMRSFEAQSLFVANASLAIVFIFLIASGILWLTLALRYFPFLAHRLAEWLKNSFNAAAPRGCAYLILLTPFVLFPRYPAAVALVLVGVWPFMQRRERIVAFVNAGLLAALLWFAPAIDRYSPVADPGSLTSLIAQANESAADPTLAALIARTPPRGLDSEKETALGLLAMRAGEKEAAVGHFLAAIERNKDASIAYVNLGNVYYLNGDFDKALEGYRKAEQVDPTDAVGQYNLAQAYIKTLLMAESSQALNRASQSGFEPIRDSFADRARATWSIYPRIYGAAEFWQMAAVEGSRENSHVMSAALGTATGLPTRPGFIIVAAGLFIALVATTLIKKHRLAFQCSNCGELTCNSCCNGEHNVIICNACSKVVTGVTSDKVLEALLRQRRQSVIVKRRKSIKWITVWIPGVRHLYYGRVVGGMVVACLFAGCVVSFVAGGYILPRWHSLDYATPLWQWILPGAGILLSYAVAVLARQLYEMRSMRGGISRMRSANITDVDSASAG